MMCVRILKYFIQNEYHGKNKFWKTNYFWGWVPILIHVWIKNISLTYEIFPLAEASGWAFPLIVISPLTKRLFFPADIYTSYTVLVHYHLDYISGELSLRLPTLKP